MNIKAIIPGIIFFIIVLLCGVDVQAEGYHLTYLPVTSHTNTCKGSSCPKTEGNCYHERNNIFIAGKGSISALYMQGGNSFGKPSLGILYSKQRPILPTVDVMYTIGLASGYGDTNVMHKVGDMGVVGGVGVVIGGSSPVNLVAIRSINMYTVGLKFNF